MPPQCSMSAWKEFIMKQQEIVESLLAQAGDNRSAAVSNFNNKHYDWSLFLWHLVIEKTLKALIVNHGEIPPYSHNLVSLAKKAKLSLSLEQREELKEISKFNLEARYDNYKRDFHKKADKKFATQWVKIAERHYQWLIKEF